MDRGKANTKLDLFNQPFEDETVSAIKQTFRRGFKTWSN